MAVWQDTVRFWLLSFGVSLLPEHVKRRDELSPYSTASMHVASGLAEMFFAVITFVVAMLAWVGYFTRTAGWTYLASQPSLDYGQFFGVGALAYVSFLLTPVAWVLLYLLVEGVVRALEASLTGRGLGLAFISLPWRLVELAGRTSASARIALLIGPARADEVVPADDSRWRMLEIYSVEDKAWSEAQVVEYLGTFYTLTGRRLVPRGPHHAYRYLLHPLDPNEVIRGTIVRYDPATTGPSQTPT
jgi:hypothetical protein